MRALVVGLAAGIALAACGTDEATAPVAPSAPPPAPACAAVDPASPLANVRWPATNAAGTRLDLTAADLAAPCGGPGLVVLRVSAGWCGTCRWLGGRTADLTARARVRLVDVLVANDDGDPAGAEDLDAWRAWVPGSPLIAADAAFVLAPPAPFQLPLSVLADARTLAIVDVVQGPDPDVLASRIDAALATLDGVTAPPARSPALVDALPRWAWEMAQAMAAPGAPPPDPSNAHADDPYAATLGEALFSDTTLSSNGQIACVTCHDPGKGRADLRSTALGLSIGDRNTPSIALAAHARSQFWDGRADSLWMQALGPIENPREMGGSRLRVAHVIHDTYKTDYEVVFGPLPPLDDAARFPPDGAPGTAAWASMAPADQDAVTKVFVSAAKAIAAYERTFRAQPNALDRYVAGDAAALSATEKQGLAVFFRAGCAQCHHGPRLTDDAFHAVRFPTGRADGAPDRGAIDGRAELASSPFSRAGAFSDAKASAPRAPSSAMLGAFRTPTLRGLPQTAPYGHGGTFSTLHQVVLFYARGGPTAEQAPMSVGTLEPYFPPFDAASADALEAFLAILTQ